MRKGNSAGRPAGQAYQLNSNLPGRLRMHPAARELALRVIGERISELLETEGPRAFEQPRSATIAHETGHAIVGAHEGLAICRVTITRR